MLRTAIFTVTAVSALLTVLAGSGSAGAAPRTQKIEWVTQAVFHQKEQSGVASAKSSPSPQIVFCTLQAEDPYFYKDDARATGFAECTALVSSWKDEFDLKFNEPGLTGTIAAQTSSTRPSTPCSEGYCKNYSIDGGTCVHGWSYFSYLSATATAEGEPGAYSNTSKAVTLC